MEDVGVDPVEYIARLEAQITAMNRQLILQAMVIEKYQKEQPNGDGESTGSGNETIAGNERLPEFSRANGEGQ